MVRPQIAPGQHTPELDTLAAALGHASADAPGMGAARRLVSRLRSVEAVSGQPISAVLDAVEWSARLAPAGATRLTASEAAALEAIGADLTPLPVTERPSLHTELSYRRMLAEALTSKQVAALLGVDVSRVRQRLTARTLLAARVKGQYRLPRFQFTDAGELPGWTQVAPQIPIDMPLLAVDRFLHTPHVDLAIDGEAVTPAQWLVSGGDPARVARLAGE